MFFAIHVPGATVSAAMMLEAGADVRVLLLQCNAHAMLDSALGGRREAMREGKRFGWQRRRETGERARVWMFLGGAILLPQVSCVSARH